jgi:hypothetical protein
MRVRDGDVYDRTLVDATLKQLLESSSGQSANVKRENKAYSYKEQLADAELRKEIEAAKKNANANNNNKKSTDPAKTMTLEQIRSQMSKKQQEMLDAQLVSEKRIREEMRELDALTQKATSILVRAIHARPLECKFHLAAIMRTCMRLFRSPIACSHVLGVLKTFTRAVYERDEVSFNDAVVYCLLRLVDAPVSIEAGWKQEPLDKAYARIIGTLRYELTKDFDNYELDLSKSAFLYPFLKVDIFLFFVF